jgi:hypothetical protein
MRRLLIVLLLSLPLFAANLKLYLKDGGFHLVREYQVDGDRVRFYSTERSDWEEIPVSLIDLKRTEAEAAEQKAATQKEDKDLADEQAAAREARAEIQKIPRDPGLYRLENGQLRVFPDIDPVVHNDKGRQILRGLSPIPLISGKSTLDIPGEHSVNVVSENRPEFFLQLAVFENFALVRLTPQKGVRVVEKITIVPVTKELMEEPVKVEIFQKQLSENGLYKIWPQEPLEKGDYAVVEFTPEKMNHRIWDFRIE